LIERRLNYLDVLDIVSVGMLFAIPLDVNTHTTHTEVHSMSQHQSSESIINLWYTRCGAATTSALAIQKKWLQAEFSQGGTLLHSLRDSESLELRNSHYHHKQSGMFREGGNIPPIWAKGFGQDTAVVGITWLDEYQGIIVKQGSDIREIADLKGKRLAIPNHIGSVIDFQRGAAQHGFSTALSLAGLTKDDAIFVDVEAPNYDLQDGPRAARTEHRHVELEALERGEVDAIFVRFTRGYRLSKNPQYHQVININDLTDPLLRVNNGTPRPVTVDRAFLAKHPEIVARYLAVLLRTARWAESHPEEVLQLLVPENGVQGSVDEVIGSHGPNVHLSFTPKLSDDYITGLNAQKNFLRDWGYLKSDFDINDWIVKEPLAEAHKLFAAEPEFTEFSSQIAA
jgi:ABC-type nitrate/sulfonate/bicarbonate transport system substrate-binding protein